MRHEKNSILDDGPVKSFYVRTMIEYDSDSDYSLPKKGLSFEVGEILLVKNASDYNWWSAKKLNPIKENSDETDEGIIPSAERLKKRYTNKEIAVNFEEKTIVIEPNGSQTSDKINSTVIRGSGSIDLKKKRQQTYLQSNNIKLEVKDKLCDFYEIVEPVKTTQLRPVIVVGPGRTKLYDKFIERYPDKFSSPVNHTTRPKRDKEVEGIDYHFIDNKEEFQKDKDSGLFVETVEYSGNFYGTSLLSVKNVINSRRHCIIDATVKVIQNLENNGIFPISILICPDTYTAAKALMGETTPEKLIKTTMQYSSSLNCKDRQMFTVKLRCATMDELIKEAYTAIMNCQKWGVWTKLDDQSKLGTEKL